MKSVSTFAMALMLSLGVVTAVAMPEVASAKDKKPAADPNAEPPVSSAFQKPINAAMTAAGAKDNATAETQVAAAEAVAKGDSDLYYVQKVRLILASNKGDKAGIAQQLDLLIANPSTPSGKLVFYTYLRGSVAADLKQNDIAVASLLKARELGSTEAAIPQLLAQAYAGQGKSGEAVAELEKAIAIENAAGRKAPDSWYSFAFGTAYKAGDKAGAAKWLSAEFQAYPTLTTWHNMMATYRNEVDRGGAKLPREQRLDLFRLLRASKSLIDESDYWTYADAATKLGLPWETLSVIEEGRATNVIPARAADFDEVYRVAKASIANGNPIVFYEKQALAAPTGVKAQQTADSYLASGNYTKALELYGVAASKGGSNADNINFRSGVALYKLGRKDEAKAAFAKVQAPILVDIAHYWTIWIDTPALAG